MNIYEEKKNEKFFLPMRVCMRRYHEAEDARP